MKIVGLAYLRDTLKPIIDLIFSENKDCEIDPSKMEVKKGKLDDMIAQHSATLIGYDFVHFAAASPSAGI